MTKYVSMVFNTCCITKGLQSWNFLSMNQKLLNFNHSYEPQICITYVVDNIPMESNAKVYCVILFWSKKCYQQDAVGLSRPLNHHKLKFVMFLSFFVTVIIFKRKLAFLKGIFSGIKSSITCECRGDLADFLYTLRIEMQVKNDEFVCVTIGGCNMSCTGVYKICFTRF